MFLKVWQKSINMDLEPLCRSNWFSEWQDTLVDILVKLDKNERKPGCADNQKINWVHWADAELNNFILVTLFCIIMHVKYIKQNSEGFFFFLINDVLLALIQLVYILYQFRTLQSYFNAVYCSPHTIKEIENTDNFLVFWRKYKECFCSWLNLFLSSRKASLWSRMNLWKLP